MEKDLNLDLDNTETKTEVIQSEDTTKHKNKRTNLPKENDSNVVLNCLTNKKVIVRYISKDTGFITNPKHVFYGGMAETATRTYVTPRLSSGAYVNVLTKQEQLCLEEVMGVEQNTLSIHTVNNNYWETFTVRLTKGDNILNLSNPIDYIKYKVLLANKDFIAPSLTELQDKPLVTYQFVLISEEDETKQEDLNLSFSMEAYMKLGEISSDIQALRLIIETFEGRPLSSTTRLDVLKVQAHKAVQANPKLFLSIAKDPMLNTKILLRVALEKGIVVKRGDFLYLKEGNVPLCDYGQDPTLKNACIYLNTPKYQDTKFMIEAKIK